MRWRSHPYFHSCDDRSRGDLLFVGLVIDRWGISLLATLVAPRSSSRLTALVIEDRFLQLGSSTMRNFFAITQHHEYKTLLDAQRGKERLR